MSNDSVFQYEKADDSAGFLLWKITALWQQKLAAVLGALEITQTQYAIMASLKWFEEHGEPATQGHLVEHTKIDKMTVSKAIRKLETAGFITRTTSTVDTRAVDVEFTAFGRKQIRKAIVAVENADEAFFAHLTRDELKVYCQLTLAVIAGNSPVQGEG
jgi:DNA-binding MarR family transcriptional regulator